VKSAVAATALPAQSKVKDRAGMFERASSRPGISAGRIFYGPYILGQDMDELPPHLRFQKARERQGLSHDQLAIATDLPGFGSSAIWDIEEFEDDLTTCHSPSDLRKYCRVLKIKPADLFGAELAEPPVTPEELVRLIHEECRQRGITLEQFEEVVGWWLSRCMDPPQKLLEEMSLDGLQWLCQELHMDWRRAL